jgi:hypothetical protein
MSQSPSKTQGTSLLSIQNLANNTVLISSAQDVSTKFSVTVFVHIGRDVATALTLPCNVRIQASAKSSGGDEWLTLATFASSVAAAATQNTLAASGNNAGVTTLTATGNWNPSDGDLVFVKNGTIGNSEFVRAGHISTTSMPVFDATTNAQNSSTALNKADEFIAQIDVSAIGRIRVAIDTLGTGQAVNVEAYMITCDSIG